MNFDVFVPATSAIVSLAGTEPIPAISAGVTKRTTPNAILALGAQFQGGVQLSTTTDILCSSGGSVIDAAGDYLWPGGGVAISATSHDYSSFLGTTVIDDQGQVYYPTGPLCIGFSGQLFDNGANLIADGVARYFGPNNWQDSTTSAGSVGQVLVSAGSGQPVAWGYPTLQYYQVILVSDISIAVTGTQIIETISSIGGAGQVWMFVGTLTGLTGLAAEVSGCLQIVDSSGTVYARSYFEVPISSSNNTFEATIIAAVAFSAAANISLVIDALSVSGTTTIAGSASLGQPGTRLIAVRLA